MPALLISRRGPGRDVSVFNDFHADRNLLCGLGNSACPAGRDGRGKWMGRIALITRRNRILEMGSLCCVIRRCVDRHNDQTLATSFERSDGTIPGK